MFGGDEVNAIVVDVGSHAFKVGWAGEDAPRHCVPAVAGSIPWDESKNGIDPLAARAARGTALSSGEVAGGDADADMVDADAVEEKAADGPAPHGGARRAAARARSVIGGRHFVFGDMKLAKPTLHGQPLSASPLMSPQGTVTDWDSAEAMWWHLFSNCMYADPRDHPLLVSERLTADMTVGMTQREALAQLAFEKLDCPAIFVAKGPVLTAFASGRPTALVVEVGALEASACAVHDGFALHKSLNASPLGGDALTTLLQQRLAARSPPAEPIPLFRLRKTATPAGAAAGGTAGGGGQAAGGGDPMDADGAAGAEAAGADASFDSWHVRKLVEDAKQACCQVAEVALGPGGAAGVAEAGAAETGAASAAAGGADSGAGGKAPHAYELPGRQGWIDMTLERLELAELLLQPAFKASAAAAMSAGSGRAGPQLPERAVLKGGASSSGAPFGYPIPAGSRSLADLASAAIAASDPDIRRELFSSVVLAGGSSLFPGLSERLQADLAATVPQLLSLKVKVLTATTPVERQHAAWIGGSILASLGSFQQLWMSRKEWEEEGPSAIHRKCP